MREMRRAGTLPGIHPISLERRCASEAAAPQRGEALEANGELRDAVRVDALPDVAWRRRMSAGHEHAWRGAA